MEQVIPNIPPKPRTLNKKLDKPELKVSSCRSKISSILILIFHSFESHTFYESIYLSTGRRKKILFVLSQFFISDNPIYVNLGDIGSASNKLNGSSDTNLQENSSKVVFVFLSEI